MVKKSSVVLGKAIRSASRLRGGGSALPGLVVEKLDKNFLKDTLGKLPYGVVIISGTNGKTTTVKIVKELLEGQGLKVFTNSSGSNFKRGVIASLIKQINLKGQLDADIAVLELDEAHALHFIKDIKPRFCLLLNVMRDQLDRFGEIDKTAGLLAKIAESTTGTVVLNREDKRLLKIADSLNKKTIFYGYNKKLHKKFMTDEDLYSKTRPNSERRVEVELDDVEGRKAIFKIGQQPYSAELKLSGTYNAYNSAGALALVRAILGKSANIRTLINTLSNIEGAFGRGEILDVGGTTLQLILVKNPISFRLALDSYSAESRKMIVINDNYADGRDMSWLWDVDFSSLTSGVDIISGTRADDMALRLAYDEVTASRVEPDIKSALKIFIENNDNQAMKIFCTYTAMLKIRKLLGKYTKVRKML